MKIVIVGGGVNGVLTALQFSKKRHEVTIFDQGKLFSETSSKSTKILHGGIRYLENLEFFQVRNSLIDRKKWVDEYKTFAKPKEFFIPIYKNLSKNKFYLYFGVKLYDILAGKSSLGKSHFYSIKETLEKNPILRKDNLLGSVSYWDVQMDDNKIMSSMIKDLNKCGITVYENFKIDKIGLDGHIFSNDKIIEFDFIINACGPWANELLNNSKIKSNFLLQHIRGSHLLLDKKINNPLCLQNISDNRIIFMLPFKGKSILGTTEVVHNIKNKIKCSLSEMKYLLKILNDYTEERVYQKEIVSSYSGIRPIIRKKISQNFSKSSREAALEIKGKLLNIYGGKWTSSKSLAESVYNKFSRHIKY